MAGLLASALLVQGIPASAQAYTGYIQHPYPNAGTWYCDWYSGVYWCQDQYGNWFRANPDWYDQAMRDVQSAR